MEVAESNNSLAEALNAHFKTDELKPLVAAICSEVPGTKPERIKTLVAALMQNTEAIFAKLSPPAQHAVEEATHTWDGLFHGRMFQAKYSASPWLSAKDKNGQPTGEANLLGLFIIDNRIPGDLLKKLRDIVPLPPADDVRYAEAGPAVECTVRETSGEGLANVAMVLQLVGDKKIRVGAKTGRATAASLAMIGEQLSQGDWYNDEHIGPMQAFAWPLLLQGGGLAKMAGTSLELSPAGVKARKNDPAAAIKTIWNKWEKSTFHDEFSRVTAIKGQKSKSGRTMTSPARRRPMINMLLEELIPGQWIAIDELARLFQSDSEFSFSMTNYDWKLYFFDQQYGHLDYHDTWPLLQLRYLLVYLFEYCATLGLIDIAYTDPRFARPEFRSCWGADDLEFLSHCDGLRYIRVNDLGAYVFGHRDTFSKARDTQAIYDFDGRDIVFVGDSEISPGQTLYLDKIGKRREVDRWQLSAATLLKAISGGESLADIQTTLVTASAAPFTQELEQLFREVEQRSTAFVEVGRTALIECSSEMRQQVLTNKKTNRLCMPAGDRYLVIFPGKEKSFVSAIEALGYSISLDPRLQ
ncbi:MAG: hypothetical protein V2B20_27850 [Pseudomonadota bacterium]